MTTKYAIIITLLFLAFLLHSIGIASASTDVTWYFRADTHTVNDILGYRLAEVSSSSYAYDTVTVENVRSTYYGVRVWVVESNGDLEELTDGEPVAIVYRTGNGEGIQTATWNCTGYNNIINAIMIKVYQRFPPDDWTLRVTFITENETLMKLPKATWTFSYYTKRQFSLDTESTTSTLYWGGNYDTKVQLQYTEPNIYEVMMWKLQNRDVLGFLMLPYTWFLGFIAYSIVFLLPLGIVLYNRLEDATATLIALLLIGGFTGGLIGALVPASGLTLCWILFVLGIAALLYRLIRG